MKISSLAYTDQIEKTSALVSIRLLGKLILQEDEDFIVPALEITETKGVVLTNNYADNII